MQKQQYRLRPELRELARLVVKEVDCTVKVQIGGLLTNSKGKRVASVFDHEAKCLVILYDTSLPSPDYTFAHECAKVIRMAKAPKDKRWNPIATRKTMKRVVRQLQKELKDADGSAPFDEQELKTFYFSLLGQLVNTPGNFWITKWLYKRYPKLKKESLKELQHMYSQKEIGMKLSNVKRYPSTFLKALNALDAVYALFLDELFGKIRFFRPYEGTEFEKLAVTLLKLNKKDNGYGGDIKVINNWAKVLGLEGWFEWKRAG